ncbi:MAG: ribonuclease, partial [Bacteroidota bacterium]
MQKKSKNDTKKPHKGKPKWATKPVSTRPQKVKPPKPIEGSKLAGEPIQDLIFSVFQDNPDGRFDPKHIVTMTGIRNNADSVATAMEKMAHAGLLVQLPNGRYKIASKAIIDRDGKKRELVGTVDMTMNGAAFIVVDGRRDDVFVSDRNLNFALDGDSVAIALFPRGNGKRIEGEVVEVLKRANANFIGLLHVFGKYAFVVPDKDNMHVDIFVPLDQLQGGKNGEKVVVKIMQWHGKKDKNPIGKVTTVLGEPGSSDIAMKSILVNAGFNLEFPENVHEEAELLDSEIGAEELASRRDFRSITTFTIDPEDAKDFDDALSISRDVEGNIEVGVHIADVTHYVRPSSAMDEEAYRRSTSVYLVDRVLPMLPEKISNELCSLRPNEDKRTFSVVFTFNKDFKMVDRWYGKTYIHSNRRFSYEEAQVVLETGEGDFADELLLLDKIAKKMRDEKFKNGAINFDSPEVRFKLDETGKPIDVYVKERKEAHLLIEDFMLAANRAVAEYIEHLQAGQAEIPFVYRIHDEPDLDKLADFALYCKSLGVKMKLDTPQQVAHSFNELVKESAERDDLKVLLPLAIRTMAKAEYSSTNIGHYGLAFSHYSHFTSPIRRYSDVLAHRILYKNIIKPPFRTEKDKLQDRCKHISTMERRAMDAERQSVRYKQ